MPPVEVWEERARGETVESRFSFSLVRGLLLLARLANGQPARLTDLAAVLNLSSSTALTYMRTLLMVGLVEQDPETRLYRLAE
jgi:DNA-binding IclR family transcriptional regulator